MKNERIIASWDRIGPDGSADERMFSAILERNRSARERKNNGGAMSKTKKITRIAATSAACLLLMALLFAGVNKLGRSISDEKHGDAGSGTGVDGTVQGGSFPEGIDPVMLSIAVYPEGREPEDIESATLNEIDETEAKSVESLGGHLPQSVPEGYYFRTAHLYETLMKDGEKYVLLRVEYTSPKDDDANFFVQIMNYEPGTEKPIYTLDTVPEDLSDTGFMLFDINGFYAGIDRGDLTRDEMIGVLSSMN